MKLAEKICEELIKGTERFEEWEYSCNKSIVEVRKVSERTLRLILTRPQGDDICCDEFGVKYRDISISEYDEFSRFCDEKKFGENNRFHRLVKLINNQSYSLDAKYM